MKCLYLDTLHPDIELGFSARAWENVIAVAMLFVLLLRVDGVPTYVPEISRSFLLDSRLTTHGNR